jgi:hypothetical protein
MTENTKKNERKPLVCDVCGEWPCARVSCVRETVRRNRLAGVEMNPNIEKKMKKIWGSFWDWR